MKALIVKTSSMGDLLHTLPAVTDAKKKYPDIQFDWVAEESFAEIPSWHPGVDRVVPVALRRWRKNVFSTIKSGEIKTAIIQIRESDYDFVIDAQGLLKSALITLIARGKRCGMDFRTSRESLASFAYHNKYHIPRDLHAIERVRMLFAQALGYNYDRQSLNYGLNRNRFSSESLLTPYLVFLHGTSRSSKLWPEQHWIELVKIAKNQGFAVYLTWGNEQEKNRAEKIAASSDGCHVLPKMGLTRVAGLLSQASGVVGVDTGLAHLTAALAVPAVTIYMDTSPELTGSCGIDQFCLSQFGKMPKHEKTAGLRIQVEPDIAASKVWEHLQALL